MSALTTSPSGNSLREQPEHGRDLMVNRWGEVAFVVAHGYGADALRLWDKVSNAQHRRRYTDAARANVALMELPGYAEAECDANGDAYMPSQYPAPRAVVSSRYSPIPEWHAEAAARAEAEAVAFGFELEGGF